MKDKKDAADTAKIDEMLLLQSLVLDQIGDHVTITGLDGKITYVNNAELKLIGRSLQEVVGSSTAIYGEDPERGATQKQILEKTLKAGAWRSDVVNIAADGTRHVMDCRTQVVRDDSGAPIAICGISTDITERKRMEEELKKKMNQIEEINRHMMGREMRVIEMKKEVNALLAELGREAKYSL